VNVTTLQQQARALGDPTRHHIFRYIADSDRPADVTEMTAHFGLNHNAIRQHLAKLVDAGLVVESISAARGRGRPRLEYIVDPAADGRWGVTSPYERLSVLLTEMIHEGENPVEAGARAGRRHRVDGSTAEHAVAGITAAMAREGFDPELRHRRGRTEIVLRNCPFESAALADPDTVCTLHLGIARGLAEGTSLVVEDLIRRDPRRANCLLRLGVAEDAELEDAFP
jgi:predicted ArsR family transcriptional regulator